MAEATFYTLADARFFVGTVALLNSLRLTGHTGELVVLDCGFDDEQREMLAPHATLVELPDELAERTVLSKPYVHALHRSGALVWIDSDIIVTRSLEPIVARAEAGRVCLYPVDWTAQRGRRFSGWQRALGVAKPAAEADQPQRRLRRVRARALAEPPRVRIVELTAPNRGLLGRWQSGCLRAEAGSARLRSLTCYEAHNRPKVVARSSDFRA